MATTSPSAQPLQVLSENVKALEAAILTCLAKPRKKAVHQLRTATRRIEAQLELLSQFEQVPAQDKDRDNAMCLLKQLRRAAGHIRDVDVQRDLDAELPPNATICSKPAVNGTTSSS